MRHVREALMCLALLAMPVAGCAIFEPLATPSAIGCTKVEETACRLVVAGHLIKSANATIVSEVTRGTLTSAEAERIRGLTRKAEEALAQARAVAPLANATTAERLAALEALLVQLLNEQLMKAGA